MMPIHNIYRDSEIRHAQDALLQEMQAISRLSDRIRDSSYADKASLKEKFTILDSAAFHADLIERMARRIQDLLRQAEATSERQ